MRVLAGLIAEHKAAEEAPPQRDPDFRPVSPFVAFRVNAEFDEERFAPESGLDIVDHRHHAEPRPLLEINGRHYLNPPRAGLGDHRTGDRVQRSKATGGGHFEQALGRNSGGGQDLGHGGGADCHRPRLVQDQRVYLGRAF